MEQQQAMEWEVQRRESQREARRRDEEARKEAEFEREKQRITSQVEKEEREKARAEAERQYAQRPMRAAPPAYSGAEAQFCSQCGNTCHISDKFCSTCGNRLPASAEGRSRE